MQLCLQQTRQQNSRLWWIASTVRLISFPVVAISIGCFVIFGAMNKEITLIVEDTGASDLLQYKNFYAVNPSTRKINDKDYQNENQTNKELSITILSHKRLKKKDIQRIDKIMKNRLDRVKSVCQRRQLNSTAVQVHKRDLGFLFVDEVNKLIYCASPKTGSTTWKKILLVLMGKADKKKAFRLNFWTVHSGRYAYYLRGLHTYTEEEINYRLKNYFKFMFVRHPFTRQVSAFMDKFFYQKMPYSFYYGHIKNLILMRYGESKSVKDLLFNRNISFNEFARYLTDEQLKDYLHPFITGVNDHHWATLDELCLPCEVNYNFIGKYENLQEESNYLLRKLNFDNIIRFPTSNLGFGRNDTKDFKKLVFKRQLVHDQELVRKLYNKFKWEFQMFNYAMPETKNVSKTKQ